MQTIVYDTQVYPVLLVSSVVREWLAPQRTQGITGAMILNFSLKL
jgi:hypothetical protein